MLPQRSDLAAPVIIDIEIRFQKSWTPFPFHWRARVPKNGQWLVQNQVKLGRFLFSLFIFISCFLPLQTFFFKMQIDRVLLQSPLVYRVDSLPISLDQLKQ